MSKTKKLVIGLLAIIIILPLSVFGYLYFKINSMYDKEEAKDISNKIEKVESVDGITNILLVGVDGNNLERGNRSDAMMILTLDEKNKDIRLTSLARDTYVDIPGYSTEKLTHAYAYEGASLLLQTINENFGIAIDKYAAVSFDSFKSIIDSLGGVEIDVASKEVDQIPGVTNAGVQTLNGEQALAYSRIRYIDSAYERDNRQRKVIQSTANKLLQSGSSNILQLGNNILRYTKTNITPMELVGLVNKAIKINDKDFKQIEFPFESHRTGRIISDKTGWVIEWDKDYNREQLHNFIFDYENYKPE